MKKDDLTIRKEHLTDLLSLLIGSFVAVFLKVPQVEIYTIDWFIFKFFQCAFLTILTRGIFRFFFSPPSKLPEVPERRGAFDEAILGARYNFCSTSTKEIALWESPTFLYYLNLNTLRMISEKAKGLRELTFSNDPTHKKEFYQEGRQLVKDFAEKNSANILKKFVALRFLIYPEEVYKEKEKEIETLISIQAIGSIHCIPVVREKLLENLTQMQKRKLRELSTNISQRIKDEYTFVSRWQRMVFWLKKEKNPYISTIPDFLIIDAYGTSDASSVRWYEGNEPKGSSEAALIELAEECFSIIAKVVNDSWEKVIWNKFHPDLFTRVPIFIKIPVMVTFFAKNYYQKWLHEIVPKYPALQRWIEEEENILKEIIKSNKITSALDIGCGWGRHMEILLQEGVNFCAGVDKEPSMIEKASYLYEKFGKDRVFLYLGSATELTPFKDNVFDLVICNTNTFGNIPPEEREKIIEEIFRVLKNNGIFMVSVYANTTEAKELREKTYREAGLRPYPSDDPSVIVTQEGLYSKQFEFEEIESYLKKFKKIENKIDVDRIAFIVIARK